MSCVQTSTVLKYGLADKTFSQFFPDEPNFPFSPAPKGRGSLPGTGSHGKVSGSDWLVANGCSVLIGWLVIE